MGSFTVRKISDETKQSVREVAAKHGRSIEAELRALIEETYSLKDSQKAKPDDWARRRGEGLIEYLLRIAPDGDGFDIPPREKGIPDPEFP